MNWHVTDSNPTHHIDQCGATEPFTRSEYHMCCLSAGHEDECECRACDATWTRWPEPQEPRDRPYEITLDEDERSGR